MARRLSLPKIVRLAAIWLSFAGAAMVGMLHVTTLESAHAQAGLLVSNHVFTTRVIRSADDTFFVQDVLVGFERGTASFQTLTQVVLPRGNHRISLAIVDPGGSELSRITFPVIEARSDNWTQSLEGTWRNIRFTRSGIHQLVVYLDNVAAARFYLVVT